MNVKLLRKVQKHILEEPKRLDMGQWLNRYAEPQYHESAPACGTVGCIAGWACALEGLEYAGPVAGALKLGLSAPQTQRLFHRGNWPKKFRSKYKSRRNPKQLLINAQLMVKRIDHFIKTRGRE